MPLARVFKRQSNLTLFALAASLFIAGCSSEDDLASSGASRQLQNALLSWVPPVEREDNTPISLAEIDGYRIYYGEVSGDYQYDIEINDAYKNQANLSLPAGTYYAVVTTIDVDGRESMFSNEISLGM